MSEVDKFLEHALEAVQREKEPLVKRLRALTEQEGTIRSLLSTNGRSPVRVVPEPNRALAELMDRLLVTRDEVFNVEVRKAADEDGIPYKDGRSINAIFLGLKSRGQVERIESGAWRRLTKSQQILNSLG